MSPFLALHTGVQTRIAGSNYGANKGERKWKNYSKRDLKRRISLLMAASSPSWQEMKKRKVVWGWEGGGTEFERTENRVLQLSVSCASCFQTLIYIIPIFLKFVINLQFHAIFHRPLNFLNHPIARFIFNDNFADTFSS